MEDTIYLLGKQVNLPDEVEVENYGDGPDEGPKLFMEHDGVSCMPERLGPLRTVAVELGLS